MAKQSRKQDIDDIVRDCRVMTKLLVDLTKVFVEYSKDQIKKSHDDLKETIDLTERRKKG